MISWSEPDQWHSCFRRTLVRLKRGRCSPRLRPGQFQTNSREVEASIRSSSPFSIAKVSDELS